MMSITLQCIIGRARRSALNLDIRGLQVGIGEYLTANSGPLLYMNHPEPDYSTPAMCVWMLSTTQELVGHPYQGT